MTRYVSKPKPMDLRKIVRLGANPGYFQLEGGEVINLAHHCDVKEGDHILFVDDEPVDILNPEELRFDALEIGDDIDPMKVENEVDTIEFVDGDPQTLCVITMKDGRKYANSAIALTADEEERRQMAYTNALIDACNAEVQFLQRLHHYSKEGS